MKLGVAYNLFDGEELLESSLKNMREKADYIVVVYQTESNFGEVYRPVQDEVLRLKELGLIDEAIKYIPELLTLENGEGIDPKSGTHNETKKRNIGLDACRNAECDYILTMDCDEFYDSDEFDEAFEEVVDGNYDTSFCQMGTYYKEVDNRMYPDETYYVPFICKIYDDSKYEYRKGYPVTVDRTRMLKAGNCLVLDRYEIEMHHLSYVRKDISRKFYNSSSRFPNEEIEACIESFNNWEFGSSAKVLGNREFEVKKGDPIISLEWQE